MVRTGRFTSGRGSERSLCLEKAVVLILTIIIFVSIFSVTAYAATKNCSIQMDTAKQVGTITYNGTSYPLFNVQVNLQEYDAISIVKESGTITVNGKKYTLAADGSLKK